MCETYVTCEQCSEFRESVAEKSANQEVMIVKLNAETDMIKKIMFSILGVLISGFVGTIFAVLSI